ncbi:MAG: Rpn family recombination-promoting nuclease/putative transposase [Synergistaceae bacterium]|jgi:predicted transposase/invertase (TIGR01784 family)|nr:Rpn family recombination-promoting nuclease/putative transposase [Synergistaceae bacterium]
MLGFNIEIHSLELNKLPGGEESDDSLLDWLWLMKAERMEEYEMLAAKNPSIKQTVDILKRLSSDRKTRLIYDAREKARMDERARMRGEYNKGKTEGKEEGIEEGIERGKLEVALNLLAEGMSPEAIARSVRLPIEKIRELMN